ncbi:MAG: hypothetical protein ACJ8FT_10105 [Sphingomonas sp.]
MNVWKNVRLELASTNEFPAGSVSRAYLIRLPLGDDDRVDEAAYLEDPTKATVRRHWSSEPDISGSLSWEDGAWIIRCSALPDRWLELDGKPIRLGQRIEIITDSGTTLPFRVATIR